MKTAHELALKAPASIRAELLADLRSTVVESATAGRTTDLNDFTSAPAKHSQQTEHTEHTELGATATACKRAVELMRSEPHLVLIAHRPTEKTTRMASLEVAEIDVRNKTVEKVEMLVNNGYIHGQSLVEIQRWIQTEMKAIGEMSLTFAGTEGHYFIFRLK